MIAKSKLMLALLGIALLLWNPAGVCAGTPSGGGRSHPCCPASSTHHGGNTGACVCIDRQPAAPSLPSLDDGQVALLLPASVPAPPASFENEAAPGSGGGRPAEDRVLTFHQLLI